MPGAALTAPALADTMEGANMPKSNPNRGICKRCGGPKEPGRIQLCLKCGENPVHRVLPCKRCGGVKDGGQGTKYCVACQPLAEAEAYERLKGRHRAFNAPCGQCGGPKELGQGKRLCESCRQKNAERREQVRQDREERDGHLRADRVGRKELYDLLFSFQDGLCATCGTDVPGTGLKTFHLDHNHLTGEVRGLLCHNCNTGIGQFAESVERLEAVIRYLQGDYPMAQMGPVNIDLVGNRRLRLSEDDVRFIRQAFSEHQRWERSPEGTFAARMSVKFGVSEGTINTITAGRSWKHVTI